jgi:hypothetical protein
MKPIYRVIKNIYYEQCDIKRTYYSVQKQWKFLWWTFWFTLKETNCGMGDCYKVDIKFETESHAIHAIKNLQQGMLADGWVEEVSVVIDFNKKS